MFAPLPYTPLGSAEVERMIRRSQAEVGAGDESVTPEISPLPYPPKQCGGAAHAKESTKTAKNGPSALPVGGTASAWAAGQLPHR